MVFSTHAHAVAAIATHDREPSHMMAHWGFQQHDQHQHQYSSSSSSAEVLRRPQNHDNHDDDALALALASTASASSSSSTTKRQPTQKKKKKASSSSTTSSSTTTTTTTTNTVVVRRSTTNKQTKKLSTDRSRLCRQRQKHHAEELETSVALLRDQVHELSQVCENLRREQLFHTASSRSGSLQRIVREYCSIFQHGMAPETGTGVMTLLGRKRSLVATRQLSAQQQCDFLLSILDPEVLIFDWVGRSKTGPDPIVHGWKAWSKWHATLTFRLESVDVIEAANDTVAVSTRGKLCVKISSTTIANLFPHIAKDPLLCQQLIGQEIQYPFKDTFFFNPAGRVCKYTVDLDFIGPMTKLFGGNFQQVAHVISPENDASFNDRAISTYDGCSLEELRDAPVHHCPCPPAAPCPAATVQEKPRDARLDVQFLLS